MDSSKRRFVFIGAIGLLIISITLNFITMNQNQKYEEYLSQEIAGTFSAMERSMNNSYERMSVIVKKKETSKEDLDILQRNYQGFAMDLQDLAQMASKIKGEKIRRSSEEYAFNFSLDLHYMIMDIENKDEIIDLSADEVSNFSRMLDLTRKYVKLFEDYRDGDFDVSKDFWTTKVQKVYDVWRFR
ncbi:hypothetical protein LGQ02_11375 [Bacillus shivajii]|uniref:hypothetical protein n=1 Tax=Bacillus shivajii TaxID=1983719 RepID=UPI001CFC4091|nr:hypothetical protein [Bacillus shivajii]UCZ51478.1 hypothetical protein LGQ02_11375 [Bacillus shivajii]